MPCWWCCSGKVWVPSGVGLSWRGCVTRGGSAPSFSTPLSVCHGVNSLDVLLSPPCMASLHCALPAMMDGNYPKPGAKSVFAPRTVFVRFIRHGESKVTNTYGLADEPEQKPQPFLFLRGICVHMGCHACAWGSQGITLGSLSVAPHFNYVLRLGLSLSSQLTDCLD